MEGDDDGLAMFADENDALVWVVHKLGGFKRVGCLLRPEYTDKPDQGAQWLRDCLNTEKRERITPAQTFHLLRLARQAGFHAAKFWIDDELGYQRGRPLSVEDEAARLQREFVEAVRAAKHIGEKLERLTQTPLQAISGGRS